MIVGGVAYFQDLDSGVWAIKMSTGKLLWPKEYNSPNVGPDGVNVVGSTVYGATNAKAFALSAATGEQLWSQKLIRNKGEGIDMAPAVNNGTVYVSTVPGNGVNGVLHRRRRRGAVGDERQDRQDEVELERGPDEPLGQQEGQLRRRPVAATDV